MAYGQLHTSTKYVTDGTGVQNFNALQSFLDRAVVIDLQQQSINALERQEKKYYAEYGCNNYESFRNKLREIFKKAEQDKKALSLFKKRSLDNIFGVKDNSVAGTLDNSEIIIKFKKLPTFHSKELGFTFLDKEFDIKLNYNHTEIKDMLNSLLELKGQKQKYRLQSGAKSMKRAKEIIKDLISEGAIDDIVLVSPNIQGDISVRAAFQSVNDYDKNSRDIEQMDREAYLEWKDKIFTSVFNLLEQGGASEELQRAFYDVWSQKTNYELDYSFFAQGLGKLKSNLQELAVAALENYIHIQLTGEMPEKAAQVVGDVVEGKREMPKTDVEVLKAFGIQVKAYQQSKNYGLEANIHPFDLDRGLQGINKELGQLKIPDNLGDYLVQHYINASNPFNQMEFIDAMRQALAQVMSLQTTSEIEDTVSFYLIDLQYLVPGSLIVKRFNFNNPARTIGIWMTFPSSGRDKTGYITGTNEFFDSEDPGFKRKNDSLAPNFVYYYQGRPNNLKTTDKNKADYDELYTHSISIRIDFDFNFMFSSYYSIY